MTMLLDGHGLMGHLTGATPPPPTTILTNDIAFFSKQFFVYVENTVASTVVSADSSKQTWILLHTLHANKSHTRIYSLKDQLTDRVIKGLKGVFQYLLEIKRIKMNLPFGLNSDFKKVSASIRTCDTPVEYEVLFQKLLDHESFLQHEDKSHTYSITGAVATKTTLENPHQNIRCSLPNTSQSPSN
ncbi:hypothetical protein ES319_D07G216100v1 [Gossypium barbadense]|uniref:Uncharacterized protein n=2 Tax=Gossypium TaxID=3633 RepID=A0A5J5QXB8_GOSBA|nr:hypothetical protein ES319_D07G216100v1 [Gossypium barbadense]TYG62458.1 hypothetical protein ES288_D07G232900v1 [Gossypium darwinii]